MHEEDYCYHKKVSPLLGLLLISVSILFITCIFRINAQNNTIVALNKQIEQLKTVEIAPENAASTNTCLNKALLGLNQDLSSIMNVVCGPADEIYTNVDSYSEIDILDYGDGTHIILTNRLVTGFSFKSELNK